MLRFLVFLYWRVNRPFVRALAGTLIGPGEGDLKPDTKQIVKYAEDFLRRIPTPAAAGFIGALFLFPISVPARVPYSRIGRLVREVWTPLWGQFARLGFELSSRAARARKMEVVQQRLAAHAASENDEMLKSIVFFKAVKMLLFGSYLEQEGTWRAMGYNPFPQRDWDPPSGPNTQDPPPTAITQLLRDKALTGAQLRDKARQETFDYCVIGSGAGGAIAALRIKELDADASVLLLESGALVTNEQFVPQTLRSVADLYKDGGATLSTSMKIQFRQGHCVGGSTTVNNAVALTPEGYWWQENIVDRWTDLGVDLEWDEFHQSFYDIATYLRVHPVLDRVLSPMSRDLRKALEKTVPPAEGTVSPINVNVHDCIGCGRCNFGCNYDAKLSMNVTAIPDFVRAGGLLAPDAPVERIDFAEPGGGTVRKVVCRVKDGGQVEIKAKKYVLAAGGITSSKLLWSSDFTGASPGVRTVGKRFTGNFGTPLFGRLPYPAEGMNGIQEGTVVDFPKDRYVLETWFQTPGVYGLLAPHWGEDFQRQVSEYSNMACIIVVIGASDWGQIRRTATGRFTVDYELTQLDWIRLRKGLEVSARAMFDLDVEEIYSTRFDGQFLTDASKISEYFSDIGPNSFVNVETAHLQGGNIIHEDARSGVVDGSLKVHGVDNLWITDASVIPASTTLNVQTTVMALAHYGAPRIVAA